MSFREEEGQNKKKSSFYFLGGWFGQFVFLLLHFATIPLNPDKKIFLKAPFFLYTQLPLTAWLSRAKGN